MALNPLQKIKLQKQARTILADLKGGGLSPFEKIKLQKEWRQVIAQLKGGAAPAPDTGSTVNPLFTKYKTGGFNGDNPNVFKEAVQQVHDEGLPFSEVREGVIAWIEANPQYAQAA